MNGRRAGFGVLLLICISASAERARVPEGWLGAGVSLKRGTDGTRFLFVEKIAPGGPAEAARLQPLDVITHFDRRPVTFRDEVEFLERLIDLKAGQRLPLRVRRADKTLDLMLTVGAMTPERLRKWQAAYDYARQRRPPR